MKCPVCGCEKFYVKDPDDEYEVHEFEAKEGQVVFCSDQGEPNAPEINEHTDTHCNKCAWHGEFRTLKKPK